ncbi:hypothetical protein [Pseudomonas sp. SJZ080]|uniref:hypothetical protein n=1 Tax=Pseudomonas sp. SJZ080 TaxID=2572888 RepID=UPI0011A565BD|nr:hypothetical protein [Pseudomonas sp. SJZ080]
MVIDDLCFFNELKLATHIFAFVLNIELIEDPLKAPGTQPFLPFGLALGYPINKEQSHEPESF